MRMLILGEGATDLGLSEPDGTPRLEGALPILVRKIIAESQSQRELDLRVQPLSKKPRRFPEGVRRIGPSIYGYANRLRGLLALKEGREADAIIAVVDRDGRRNHSRLEELITGRLALQQAGKRCAVGVAVEMIEAWLLADEKALRTVLGSPTLQRQPDPESLDSRDERSEQHPKGRLVRLLQQAVRREVATSDFPGYYAEIAKAASIAVLSVRCPQGFQPFVEQVRELLQ